MLTLQFRFEMAMASKNLAQLILTLADYVNWPQIAEKSAVDLAKWQLKNINVKPDQRSQLELWLNQEGIVDKIAQKFNKIEGYKERVVQSQQKAQELFKIYSGALYDQLGFESIEVLDSSELRLFNDPPKIFGPFGLSAAILLADLFTLNYRLGKNADGKLQVDGDQLHKINNFLTEALQKFANSYELALNNWQHRPPSEPLWREITILTGFEIIRRCVEGDRVPELINDQFGPHDCIEAGLRLLSNDRISTPGAMVFVGLALC